MNRSTMTLIGVAVALAAVFGVATVTAPKPAAAGTPVSAAAETKPVQRSTLLCPAPTGTDYDSSTYAAYTPPGTSAGGAGGSAHMTAGTQTDGAGDVIGSKAAAHPKPIVPLTAPGKPVTAPAGKSTWPLIGTADGRFAPGWTVQQTTTIAAGAGRGLLGTSCSPASTDFWFPGASTATHRQDYVHLTNPDDTAAVVDIELYDAKGEIKTTGGEGITIPGGSSVPVLLSTLTGDESRGPHRAHRGPQRPGRRRRPGHGHRRRAPTGCRPPRPRPTAPCCPASPPTPPPCTWWRRRPAPRTPT